MARDPGLEELIRDELRSLRGTTEKAMFGGWAWLLNGNLLCGAREGSMLVRLGKERDAWALELEGIVLMRLGDKAKPGWVRAGPVAYGDDALRRKLLGCAVEFVLTLPSK
jgi:hypothetical protein